MDQKRRAGEIGAQILQYARNELLVSLRFMDLALCRLKFQPSQTGTTATDGETYYFNPRYVFHVYEEGDAVLTRAYLHAVLHCIFYHPFADASLDRDLWDLSCDIAVEGVIQELGVQQLETEDAAAIAHELQVLGEKYGKLTAERLYKALEPLPETERARLKRLFVRDDHEIWYAQRNTPGDEEGGDASDQTGDAPPKSRNTSSSSGDGADDTQGDSSARAAWQEISERIKVDLETSSKSWGDRAAKLMLNLREVNRDAYDYADFLRKFAVMGEEIQVNDDEFDYIFYTYGLKLYQNLPLIEPLEYREVKRVREFVIAIDTSGSVKGDLVERFMTKTYNILAQQESFFTKINVHIIQCDAEVQEDLKITSREEFKERIQNFQLRGFGGTDFRPVFQYVDALRQQGELTNLKGLIYFTDGQGVFPEKKPPYDAAFVFVNDEYIQPQIPVWAIKLVLSPDAI